MKRELRAIQVAVACSVLGALAKFGAGFATHAMSMVSSAVDSLGDLIVSLANLAVVRYAAQEPDEEHNYGHAKVEGLGAMFEGGFVFAAGAFIVYEAVHKYLVGERAHETTLGIATMLPVLAMTAGTVLYLRRVARETGSLVVRSDALHYATDLWVNLGVLASLVLVRLTGLPLIDTVISIAIALFMLYASARIVREGFGVVMDVSLPPETVRALREVLASCAKIESFHDFKTRAGRVPHVDFHVVVRPDMTAREVHDLFLELQARVREVAGADAKVLMHADPAEG